MRKLKTRKRCHIEYHDLGCDTEDVGYVEISGIKEGTGTLACVTNGSAKAQCTVKVAWDYEFTVDSTRITGTPDSTYTIEYSVGPTDATIEVNGNGLCEFATTNDGQGNGKLKIMPHSEGTDSTVLKGLSLVCFFSQGTQFPQSTSLITDNKDLIKLSLIPSFFISSADKPHGCPILFRKNVKLSSSFPFFRLLGKNFTSG